MNDGGVRVPVIFSSYLRSLPVEDERGAVTDSRFFISS